MHSDHEIFPQMPVAAPVANQLGGYNLYDAAIGSAIAGTVLPPGVPQYTPLHGIEFQSSEVCPKNFIIFDQTFNRSQILFHPTVGPKLCHPGLNIHSSYIRDNVEGKYACNEERENTTSNEDSDDIDALLSYEEEEEEEKYDDEVVSTARTQGNYGSDFSDSGSSYGTKPRKKSWLSSLKKSSGSGRSCHGERKREKMRKMVKALRGIVPGGNNQKNTAAVLDEAVRYLKSLKVEVQKIGVGNLKI